MSLVLPKDPVRKSLRVWDLEEVPEEFPGLTVLWRHPASGDASNQLAISRMVEARAESLRSRYLAWTFDFGEATLGGSRVIDLLKLREGLSFWWMTSLAQQFNLDGRSGINETLKAMALEELVTERSVGTLLLHSSNACLAECLRDFCRRKGIGFSWTRPAGESLRSFFEHVPPIIRGVTYLLGSWLRFLPVMGRRLAPPNNGEVLFMDVLAHLDRQALAEGRFSSGYWTDLVSKLGEWKVSCTWIHLFFRHPDIPTPYIAARLLGLFNRSAPPGQHHVLLEAHLQVATFLDALRDYWKVFISARRLRALRRPLVSKSVIDPWPLHRHEWEESLCGKEGMRNCLRICLLETAMKSLGTKKIGVYLSENQPWEFALLHAWRVSGHGEIIGVPHTTVRYWDLRYHRDPRCYKPDSSGLGFPMPDRLAVNGSLALSSLVAGGYPQARLAEVEALRFLHLQVPARRDNHIRVSGLRVLICADFLAATNLRMFSWLNSAANELPSDNEYLVKPHPAFPIEQKVYPFKNFKTTHDPIYRLLQWCDVVLSSSTTSAALDAFCAHVPVVQILDGHAFNMSPVRGLPGIVYVESAKELASALRGTTVFEGCRPTLLNLGKDLRNWGKILRVEG